MSDLATLAMEKAPRNLANPHSETNVSDLKNEGSFAFNDKDFLRDLKSNQKSFANRDVADLFTASALATDKDGRITERETPSAFHSREGPEGSAHGAGDGEDHRLNLSMSVSGPLNADRSPGSESDTDRDSAIFLGHCAKEDLDLVENAILRLLREDMSKQNDATNMKDAPGMGEHLERSDVSSAGSLDLQLLSRLLDQIQTLRDQKHQHKQVGRAARSSPRSGRSVWDICKQRNDKERRLKNDDMKKAVEAATKAAKSAADAAKVASSLATKNSETVNKLLHSANPSSSSRTTSKQGKWAQEKDKHPDSSDSDDSDSEETKKIAKKIVSQNRYTHVILGLMLVSSFVWRYIVVKVAKRVRNKVSDPWGYVQGKFTDNFKGPYEEKEKEELEKSEESANPTGLPEKLKL